MTDFEYLESRLQTADLWGQLAEEAAELAQSALKMQRLWVYNNPPRKTTSECVNGLWEELADVLLCLELLRWDDLDNDAILDVKKRKIARWAEHLRRHSPVED